MKCSVLHLHNIKIVHMGMDAQNFEQNTHKKNVQMNGWPEGAVRAYIFRAYKKKLTDVCTGEEYAHLCAKYGARKIVQPVPVVRPVQEKPVPMPIQPPALAPAPELEKQGVNASDLLLVFIIVAEMIFAVIGSFVQFSYGGLFIGCVLVAFYANTGWQMWRGESAFAQDYGMFICAIITVVFMWGAGQTFWEWYTGDPSLRVYVCGASAFLFSVVSYSSMLQLKNVRT